MRTLSCFKAKVALSGLVFDSGAFLLAGVFNLNNNCFSFFPNLFNKILQRSHKFCAFTSKNQFEDLLNTFGSGCPHSTVAS